MAEQENLEGIFNPSDMKIFAATCTLPQKGNSITELVHQDGWKTMPNKLYFIINTPTSVRHFLHSNVNYSSGELINTDNN